MMLSVRLLMLLMLKVANLSGFPFRSEGS